MFMANNFFFHLSMCNDDYIQSLLTKYNQAIHYKDRFGMNKYRKQILDHLLQNKSMQDIRATFKVVLPK